ncbi:MAG: sigma-54 dependent transcriptional regulator [Rhodothermales bacterium]
MSSQPHILFVDDEQMLHSFFERLFTRQGIKVTSTMSAAAAIEALKEQTFNLVVTDFVMPDMDGLELLAHIRREYPRTRVIMITAQANVQHAVRSMKGGAIDYIPKPFSTTELVERVQKHLSEAEDAAPEPEPEKPTAAKPKSSRSRSKKKKVHYIGEHPSIQRLKSLLPKVASNKAPVFIQGESGTGKEILSRLIHQMSDRGSGPYVTLNCANLPRELVESHLFGHRKGAFTGAIEDMTGAFERADGGTLLLDEITEIEMSIQAKLLRVLQEQEFQKIGSSQAQRVDVRVVATSNRVLSEAIAEGIFREDLYHRLSVFPLTVPPLRERLSDIPLLTKHFVKKYCDLYGLPAKTVAQDLMMEFMRQDWTGNVRQLENMIQRGVLISADREEIELNDVMNDFFSDAQSSVTPAASDDAPSKMQTIEDMERYMILQALSETNNNQQMAAERLGISARTIRNKLKRYREQGHIS